MPSIRSGVEQSLLGPWVARGIFILQVAMLIGMVGDAFDADFLGNN